MNNRLQTMPDEKIIKLAHKVQDAMDRLMRRPDGSNQYGFGGSLSYGWDWPTASAYYPRKAKVYFKLCDEGRRRATLLRMGA
jgi:hypothetical protein